MNDRRVGLQFWAEYKGNYVDSRINFTTD